MTTVSDRPDLDGLRREAAGCTRCELYGPATQTVFGEGPVTAATSSAVPIPAMPLGSVASAAGSCPPR